MYTPYIVKFFFLSKTNYIMKQREYLHLEKKKKGRGDARKGRDSMRENRPEHLESQSDFNFVQSGLDILGLSKSIHQIIWKFGSGQVQVGISKSSKNWYNWYIFGFGSQTVLHFKSTWFVPTLWPKHKWNRFFGFKVLYLYLFGNQNISKLDSNIRKEHQTWSFKIKRKVNIVIDRNKTK